MSNMPKALSNCWLLLPRTWPEELWQAVAQTDQSISYVAWPTYDESKLVEAEVEIVVQIKGKVRAKLIVAKDLSREELQEIALADEKIKSEMRQEVVK